MAYKFLADLVRCETRLYNALNDRLRERHGLVTSQFEFLRYLRDQPAARVADIATEFAIGIGATSKGADRLERQGWVERRPNPADRRSSLLALTAAGATVVDQATRTFEEVVAELIGPVPPEVASFLGDLRARLERDQIGIPTG